MAKGMGMAAVTRSSIDQTQLSTRPDAAPPRAPQQKSMNGLAAWPGPEIFQQAVDYWVDAWQRSVLFLDVLRQRGNGCADGCAESTRYLGPGRIVTRMSTSRRRSA